MADPYVYPGTQVLINKEDIRDAEELAVFERVMSAQRMSEQLPAVEISAAGYRALHRHLFQDVYEWAGEPRTVALAKGSSMFCRPPEFDS
jgi:cell filamentation protein